MTFLSNKINRFILIVLFLGLFFSCTQTELNDISNKPLNDSISLIDTADYNYLKKKYTLNDTSYLNRFEQEVLSYEKLDTINYSRKSNIVFAGSSTMRFWNRRLEKDMQPLPVIGRGFGGSTLIDNIYYFDRLILPCKPVIEVFYCANDYLRTPSTIVELFRYYDYLFHSHFPNSTLYFVSINPSVARKDYNKNVENANKLIYEYTKNKSKTKFIGNYSAPLY
jgi:hypothetical protein